MFTYQSDIVNIGLWLRDNGIMIRIFTILVENMDQYLSHVNTHTRDHFSSMIGMKALCSANFGGFIGAFFHSLTRHMEPKTKEEHMASIKAWS